jgi:hypothetical protein
MRTCVLILVATLFATPAFAKKHHKATRAPAAKKQRKPTRTASVRAPRAASIEPVRVAPAVEPVRAAEPPPRRAETTRGAAVGQADDDEVPGSRNR